MLELLIKQKGYSIHSLSQASGIPYATLYALVKRQKNVDNCSVIMLKRLAETLGIDMTSLYMTIKAEEKGELLQVSEDTSAYGEEPDAILMCKDTYVYNITRSIVYNPALLPGRMKAFPCNETFKAWMKERYSTGSNTYSRELKSKIFPNQGHRQELNEVTHAFSLTDCYWIKKRNEKVNFQEISPYFKKFWIGKDKYVLGTAIPTLYVGGALTKCWTKEGKLFKRGKELEIELECMELCKICGVKVEEGKAGQLDGVDGILLDNLTNEDVMLEQANMSGLLDPEDFTEEDIYRVYGEDGLKMLIVDAIIGNGDRHAGNFGNLRDANTGEVLSMCPLYDFDHALDSKQTQKLDVLMETAVILAKAKHKEKLLFDMCQKAQKSKNQIFTKRAEIMQKELAK